MRIVSEMASQLTQSSQNVSVDSMLTRLKNVVHSTDTHAVNRVIDRLRGSIEANNDLSEQYDNENVFGTVNEVSY